MEYERTHCMLPSGLAHNSHLLAICFSPSIYLGWRYLKPCVNKVFIWVSARSRTLFPHFLHLATDLKPLSPRKWERNKLIIFQVTECLGSPCYCSKAYPDSYCFYHIHDIIWQRVLKLFTIKSVHDSPSSLPKTNIGYRHDLSNFLLQLHLSSLPHCSVCFNWTEPSQYLKHISLPQLSAYP